MFGMQRWRTGRDKEIKIMSLIKKYNKYIFLFILSILLLWILIGFNNFVIAKPIPGLL